MNIDHMTPIEIQWINNQPVVEWLDLKEFSLTDPFFSHTIDRVQRSVRGNGTIRTDIETLKSSARRSESIDLSGLIFHMSRCGSTLISRVLAQSPRILVLGQPDPLEDLLNCPTSIGEQQLLEWLRDLVAVLGRKHRPSEQYYVVKLTSFLVLRLSLFRKAFPRSKWIFVYRNPVEVMVSIIAQPTLFLKMKQHPERAAKWLEIPPKEIVALSNEEYIARFLACMCNCVATEAVNAKAQEMLTVGYPNLPKAIWECIAPHFGIHCTPQEEVSMGTIAQFYSKDGNSLRLYQDDSAAKQRLASSVIQANAEHWVAEPLRVIQNLPSC